EPRTQATVPGGPPGNGSIAAMDSGSHEPRRLSTGGLAAWRWPLVAIVVAALVAAAYFWTLERFVRAGEAAARVPGEVVAGLERAARSFLTGDVTTRFLSSLPEVATPKAGNLE